jgi:hypothetical protein
MKMLSRVLVLGAVAITPWLCLAAFTRAEPVRADNTAVDFIAAPGSPIPVGPMAGRPAVGDCNGDGNPDVVIACGTC